MTRVALAQFELCWFPRNMVVWSEAKAECVYMYVCQTEGSVDESQRDRHRWNETEGKSLHSDDLPACPFKQATA